jgi:hypothetical protein
MSIFSSFKFRDETTNVHKQIVSFNTQYVIWADFVYIFYSVHKIKALEVARFAA